MASNYQIRHQQHLEQLLNKFRADVSHETDLGELLALRRSYRRNLLQGSSLSLVTVDNMNLDLMLP